MKKIKKAVALKYEKNMEAPAVTAVGMGYIAEKIVDKAIENKVPIVKNEELAKLITNVDVGDYIKPELYGAVAEVIAFIMEMDSSMNS